ncbi:PAP2 family protein [Listeria floridensis FSL S10-1187]|uniref:PAP2 family protein n=1 Tax=Listeria floridensis FSL S10-1187 TaxID=1265817 RepID=A0ABN0RFB9_9LIST|nr:phosphatase PAP2 family protein [Listeria floridensis]EUJ32021.1 PAP2 family protein [Listeria floridensis FSL S10-1187]
MRPRPLDRLISISGYSFPSGHAAGAATFYGLLALVLIFFFIKRKGLKWFVGLTALFIILLIMLSRVYLGVHYPSDVFAGFILGSAVLSFAFYALLKSKKLRGSY